MASYTSVLILALGFFAMTSAEDCGLEVPAFETFDYEAFSGLFRYTLYQGIYEAEAPADECQMRYWEKIEGTEGDFYFNKTWRADGVTDNVEGEAILESEEGAAHWVLTLDTSEETHILMVETDYENYAAYIECDDVNNLNYPIVSSTTQDIDIELLVRLTGLLSSYGANMEAFTRIIHDDQCEYYP